MVNYLGAKKRTKTRTTTTTTTTTARPVISTVQQLPTSTPAPPFIPSSKASRRTSKSSRSRRTEWWRRLLLLTLEYLDGERKVCLSFVMHKAYIYIEQRVVSILLFAKPIINHKERECAPVYAGSFSWNLHYRDRRSNPDDEKHAIAELISVLIYSWWCSKGPSFNRHYFYYLLFYECLSDSAGAAYHSDPTNADEEEKWKT